MTFPKEPFFGNCFNVFMRICMIYMQGLARRQMHQGTLFLLQIKACTEKTKGAFVTTAKMIIIGLYSANISSAVLKVRTHTYAVIKRYKN